MTGVIIYLTFSNLVVLLQVIFYMYCKDIRIVRYWPG